MKRRLGLIAIPLVALLGLAVALWCSYRTPPGPGTTQLPRISALAPAQVTRLRVRRGSTLIMLQRDGPRVPLASNRAG